MDFLLNLSRALAHTLVLEIKGAYPGCEAARCEGGHDAGSPSDAPWLANRAFIQQFPRMMGVIRPEITPIQQSLLQAAQATEPGFNELQTSLYEQSAPRLAAAGAQAESYGRNQSAQTDANILAGPGRQIFDQSMAMDRLANPEFYAMRESIASQLPQLMSGQLTGGETEAITRSLNQDNLRRGTMNTPNQLATVSNAMRFGDAARGRQLQGLGAATGFMGASRTGVDPLQAALGRPSQNFGQGQFLGVQRPDGNQAFATAGNLSSNAYGAANNYVSNRAQTSRDSLDRVNETMSSLPNMSL
jgi:hypothetical protein